MTIVTRARIEKILHKMVDDGMLSIENYTKIVRDNALKILKEDK